jgi:hypothetical protein
VGSVKTYSADNRGPTCSGFTACNQSGYLLRLYQL